MHPSEKASAEEHERIESLKKLILTGQELLDHPFYNPGEAGRNYIFELSNGNKKLLYFGCHHTNNPDDPMFEEIRKKLEELQPDIVYIEGMQEINDNREHTIEKRKDTTLADTIKDGENLYTLKLTIDAGIDFESPEPRQSERILYLLEKGFSRSDVFKQQMYSVIAQYQRHHKKECTLEKCKEYLVPFFRQFRNNSQWESDEIDSLEQQLIAELDLKDTKYRDQVVPNPREEVVQTLINEISRASSRFRDEYALERIAEGLKKYDRLFIVYGSAHAVRLEPALRALLLQ